MANVPTCFRSERTPSSADSSSAWSIKRADSERPLPLVSLSTEWIGIRTHFWHGRTVPCRNDFCEACQAHLVSRWHGYLLTAHGSTDQRIVFEFPANALAILDSAFKQHGTLRGFRFVASRASKKPNGRVVLTPKDFVPNPSRLPVEVDAWPVLAHIWGLDDGADGILSGGTSSTMLPTESAEVERAVSQTDRTPRNRHHGAEALGGVLDRAVQNGNLPSEVVVFPTDRKTA